MKAPNKYNIYLYFNYLDYWSYVYQIIQKRIKYFIEERIYTHKNNEILRFR
jgi:hypothetical protein